MGDEKQAEMTQTADTVVPQQNTDAGDNGGDGDRKFTQTDLDKQIERRLARQKQQFESDLADERKRAEMTASERAIAEKTAAEQRATDAIAKSRATLVRAEAQVAMMKLGLNPERISLAIRLLDLKNIPVDDDDIVDDAALTVAIDAVKSASPEWFKQHVASTVDAGKTGESAGNIDSQIASAEKAGDWASAGKLKAAKMIDQMTKGA